MIMKKTLFLSVTILFIVLSGHAQSWSGKKNISLRIGAGNSIRDINVYSSGTLTAYTDRGTVVNTEVSYGWSQRKNLLLSIGLGFNSYFLKLEDKAGNKRDGDGISFYPFAMMQKYVPLKTNKIFYVPAVLAGIEFQHENINSTANSSIVQSNFYTTGFLKIRPISVSFSLSPKFQLGVEVGEYNFNIGNAKVNQVNTAQPQLKQTNSQTSAAWNSSINVRASFFLK